MRPAEQEPARLAEFLQTAREEILREWEAEMRLSPAAKPLSRRVLRDNLAGLIDRIALFMRGNHPDELRQLAHLPRIHALERLDVGFDLRAVCVELAVLRSTILRLFVAHARGQPAELVTEDILRFDRALDEVTIASADTYSKARELTLVSLERLSAAALGTGRLEEFLPRLLEVLLDTTESADFVSLFLSDGTRLVQRAFAGRDADVWRTEEVRFGEGIAGKVAATGVPALIHNAAEEPSLEPSLRASGIRALYSVPLIHDQKVIGVAKMGSRTAYDFTAEDLQLFRAMAQRATSLIVQAQLLTELQRHRSLLDALIEQLPVGVAVTEAPSGKLVRMNAAFAELWGKSFAPDSIDEYREYRGFHPDGRPLRPDEWPLARALVEGQPATAEIEIERADGSRRMMIHKAAPVRSASGEISGAVVTLTDITERRTTEVQMLRQMELRDRMLGILGHDLRNPLGAITISAGLILRDEQAPAVNLRAASRILSAAQRAAEILEQLVDYARLRLGEGIPVTRQPMDLVELVGRICDEVEAAHPGVSIRRYLATSGAGEWDPGRIGQLVTNLLVNAARHGDPTKPIDLRLEGDADTVRLAVHNQGPPIPPELLPDLFSPFVRASNSTEGLGLGLFIASEIARAHGGRIDARSDPETGTTFTVSLSRRA